MLKPTLCNPDQLSQAIADLPTVGLLTRSSTGLVYLKIDDNYIHRVFPLLGRGINKPNYFNGIYRIGAHITLAYPDEYQQEPGLFHAEIGQHYAFAVDGLFTMPINNKHYYALKVISPSLLALRKQYGLSEELCFKQHWVGLHITVGVRQAYE